MEIESHLKTVPAVMFLRQIHDFLPSTNHDDVKSFNCLNNMIKHLWSWITHHDISFKHIQKVWCNILRKMTVPNGAHEIVTCITIYWVWSWLPQSFHHGHYARISANAISVHIFALACHYIHLFKTRKKTYKHFCTILEIFPTFVDSVASPLQLVNRK